MPNRSFRFRLTPTPEQELMLRQTVGTVRYVYNLALEQRRDFWRQHRAATGRSFNYIGQGKEVTQLRAEVDWIGSVSSSALTQALRDLDRAFDAFFAGRAGFPRPRKRGCNDSFRVQWAQVGFARLNAKWMKLRIPNVGWVKLRASREVAGQPSSVTVCFDGVAWFASIECTGVERVRTGTAGTVAIDRGVVKAVALSNGEAFNLPEAVGRLEALSRHCRRRVSRSQVGSTRRQKALRNLRKTMSRLTRTRTHWLHQVSNCLASRYDTIVLEDLRIPNMTVARKGKGRAAKAGLNRAILLQGWGALEAFLAYKLEERGGALVKVNPAYTSQECSACRTVDARSRKNQAQFECVQCGFSINADHNAAINVLRRSTASKVVEGPGCRPVEAITSGAFCPGNLAA